MLELIINFLLGVLAGIAATYAVRAIDKVLARKNDRHSQ